jgi:hypothetical protein
MNYFFVSSHILRNVGTATALHTQLRIELLTWHEGSCKLFCLFSEATGLPLGLTQHAVGTVGMKGLGLEVNLSPPSKAGTVLV